MKIEPDPQPWDGAWHRGVRRVPVGLASTVHCSLILLEVDQSDGELGKVGDVVVQKLGRLVHACTAK